VPRVQSRAAGIDTRRVATLRCTTSQNRRLPHSTPRCAAGSGPTTTHAASSTRGNWPAAALMLTWTPWMWPRLTSPRGARGGASQARWPTVRRQRRLEPQSERPGPMGLRTPYPESTIPATLPTTHQHQQVHRESEPRYMAGRFLTRLPSWRGG
jgi:hypothetical protein